MSQYRYDGQKMIEVSDLFKALALTPAENVVSVIGSGGKSTLIRQLAVEAASKGMTVVVTTTTHILPLQNYIEDNEEALKRLPLDRIVTIARRDENGKYTQPPENIMTKILAEADLVLIEADGSKRMPIKFPASYEPVIVPETKVIIMVTGFSALGRPLKEVCHRVSLAEAGTGLNPEADVTIRTLSTLFKKGYWPRLEPLIARTHVAMNQIDNQAMLTASEQMASAFEGYPLSFSAHAFPEHVRV